VQRARRFDELLDAIHHDFTLLLEQYFWHRRRHSAGGASLAQLGAIALFELIYFQ